jgi:putative chitinase
MDDGDPDGQNELVRIRTRTGHQILLHNSQDLIYIANSKGTAWIEMTSRGKIDIYAKDSVSIHTETDFNFRADRDINLEAGRNVNIKAIGNMETNVHGHYFLMVDDEAKISIRNDKHEVVGKDNKITVGQDYHLAVNKDILISAGDQYNLAAEGQIRQGSGSSFHIGATGVLYESASEIQMNGSTAASAPDTPTAAVQPPPLSTYQLPNRKKSAGWSNGNFYKADSVKSIMQRMPTFEPWDQHENVNPDKFEPERTDNTLQSRESTGVAPSPNQGKVDPVNPPDIVPGTCDPKYAKEINAPSAQPGISALKAACPKFNITSPIAVAAILGIAGGESKWKLVTESFNYTSADRLLQVFPSVFKGDRDLANQYVGNPNNSLPEFLYGYQGAKGKGMGNTQAGDGAKFIGRGYIQLTGRSNYAKYSKALYDKGIVSSATALVDNPDLVNDPAIAAAVVCAYFIDRVKVSQTDAGYFEAAYRAVGLCTPDIHAAKKAFYECFLGQLKGGIVQTGSGTILTTSDGTPVKTGVGN